MRKTIAALSLAFISCTLWAGGEILWLLFPNWKDPSDLSQYLEALELGGLSEHVFRREHDEAGLDAFELRELSLSLGSLSPNEDFDMDCSPVDEIITDSDLESGDITPIDFTMNAFNADFWSQHLLAIRMLMEDTFGVSESLFRAWLIRMIEREDDGQYIQVFVLYYLQLMQTHIDPMQFPCEYASLCTAVERVVEYDLRRQGTNPVIFYQRVCTALSHLLEILAQRIDNPAQSQALRAQGNAFINVFFKEVCPNKRTRGCIDILPRGLMSLKGLNTSLVRIFRVMEIALEEPFPCIDGLEAELGELRGQESEDLLGAVLLGARRAQAYARLAILRHMQLVASQEERKNIGLPCIAKARTRLLAQVEAPQSLLRLVCSGVQEGERTNKELARKKRTMISRNARTEEAKSFDALKRALNQKIFQMNRSAGEHWLATEALVVGPGGLASDEETVDLTECLSDTSTIVETEAFEAYEVFDEEDEDVGKPSALKRQKVSHEDKDGEDQEVRD